MIVLLVVLVVSAVYDQHSRDIVGV